MGVVDKPVAAFKDVADQRAPGQAVLDKQARRASVEGFPRLGTPPRESLVERYRRRLHRQLHHPGHQVVRRGTEDMAVELIEDRQRLRRFLGAADELLAPPTQDRFVMAAL